MSLDVEQAVTLLRGEARNLIEGTRIGYADWAGGLLARSTMRRLFTPEELHRQRREVVALAYCLAASIIEAME